MQQPHLNPKNQEKGQNQKENGKNGPQADPQRSQAPSEGEDYSYAPVNIDQHVLALRRQI